jgi:carbamoyl-phosphate synthase large subunit
MPKRTDITTILLIGSGPIVIGQACEFDYSGTQATKALREEGYRVVLVNSNPATIMTDPIFADRTYIAPITPETIEKIIVRERPEAVLPTMGGQTALNTALACAERGIFERYGVELIGAKLDAIKTAEDRELFRKAMDEIGIESAKSGLARSVEEAAMYAEIIGYPLILRPSRTLGGTGGGIVRSPADLKRMVSLALSLSPNHEVLVEQSLIGWKEFELEVMRDLKDNVVIVCSIENLDPMGVHTGDSITVAPIQTLTDKEYQLLRDASIAVMRRIGVDTGGSNVQFAINPADGRLIVIEMNPRVSRSSALASKATGFPIAKIAAKLAVGYTLDEIPNDITRETPACFEPSIDYTVVKIPRFNFEKFPGAKNELGTQMRSVGEVMSFGRTFPEALQKALASMELGSAGFDRSAQTLGASELLEQIKTPSSHRIWMVGEAFRAGATLAEVARATHIDPWFLHHIEDIVRTEEQVRGLGIDALDTEQFQVLKAQGFTDARLAALCGTTEISVRERREIAGVLPSYKRVDTCAAEFCAETPYLYSTYELPSIEGSVPVEAPPTSGKKIVILGSGPNRIGQGIEFDYCCVHAALAFREDGFESLMLNCNPETVSTDYDISNRLYFEPLTFEHVLSVIDRERPIGVVVQFGGQTPLKLAHALQSRGVSILGTPVESIDIAEDRGRFSELVDRLQLRQPLSRTARTLDEALAAATEIGFPLMLRPSFVLGGRAMRVVHSAEELRACIEETFFASEDRSVLLDRFLHKAIEVDVDCVSDGETCVVSGIMEHIERAGIHSGDSSCGIPPPTLADEVIDELERQARQLALSLQVRGLMNVQFAVVRSELRADDPSAGIYILEANPRASRTVPFVSKATGIPWAKVAARAMVGVTLKEMGLSGYRPPRRSSVPYFAVKACVFPFAKFAGVDTILGPEMKSTGEVMGLDRTFGGAFLRAQLGASVRLPQTGTAFLSVADTDKPELLDLAQALVALGFSLVATKGTAQYLSARGVSVEPVRKVLEGSPHIVDLLGEGKLHLVVNTPEDVDRKQIGSLLDSRSIRLVATELGIPVFTTMAAALAGAEAIAALREHDSSEVQSLQELHPHPVVEVDPRGRKTRSAAARGESMPRSAQPMNA